MFKPGEKSLELGGKWGLKLKRLAGDGVREFEPGGMEEVAIEPEAFGLELRRAAREGAACAAT